ncbi:MAG: tRNA (adenosine(37)-N6)-threonylcarbamoyltransferase complex dimerization subunit type 1 TsaB [Pseudomonadota bacterium]
MRVLAIETASEACSVALFEGGNLIAHDHRVLGRGHAEYLIPMIGALPGKGRADQILVSLGPGSFTGVRVGLAAARALGIAWKAEVLGYPTLALVAAMARMKAGLPSDAHEITVCMNAGHGEWFIADFDADGRPETQVASLSPEAAAQRGAYACIAGNRARELAETQTDELFQPFETLPNAASVDGLLDDCLTRDLTPIYGRAPDATPQKPRKVV